MANPFDILLDDEGMSPDARTRASNLSAALRRESDFGTLLQFMGKPTAEVGQSLQKGASQGLNMAVDKQLKEADQRMRASERAQAQANWQAQMARDVARDAEQRRQFGITDQRQRDQHSMEEKAQWVAAINPITGQMDAFNKFTGKFRSELEGAMPVGGGGPVQPGPGGVQAPGGGVGVSPLQQAGGKPPTESESKSGMRGAGTTDALSAAQEVIARNPGAAKPGWIETGASIIGMSPEQQQLVTQAAGGADRGIVRSAMEGAVDAALTEMTGAAYTPVQLATYRARFMPTILDNRESRAAKAQQMIDFVRQQSVAAGRAWTPEREQQLLTLIGKMNQGFDQQGQKPAAGIPTAQPSSGRNFEAEYGVK